MNNHRRIGKSMTRMLQLTMMRCKQKIFLNRRLMNKLKQLPMHLLRSLRGKGQIPFPHRPLLSTVLPGKGQIPFLHHPLLSKMQFSPSPIYPSHCRKKQGKRLRLEPETDRAKFLINWAINDILHSSSLKCPLCKNSADFKKGRIFRQTHASETQLPAKCYGTKNGQREFGQTKPKTTTNKAEEKSFTYSILFAKS